MKNVLFINKPSGITSFDVCKKLRSVFHTKKIGHTGTLDPLANGVLIILLDKATKANQFLVTAKKRYYATMALGKETDTLDLDGKIIKEKAIKPICNTDLEIILNSFKGAQKQLPPLTSAIKVNGKKLYEYQRLNKEVEIPLRDIEIYDLRLVENSGDTISFEAEVSGGTYIRSLVRDIAYKMDNYATLASLTRLAIDDITLDKCADLDAVLKGKYELHSLKDLLEKRYYSIETNDPLYIKAGKRIKADLPGDEILITYHGEALAIYKKDGNEYKSIRGLF